MNKIIVITGATDGIGRVTSVEIAKKGYDLVLLGRNSKKLESLKSELEKLTTVHTFVADLSLVNETIEVSKKIQNTFPKIDVLLNNAGAYFADYTLTKDGLESTFALNHLNYMVMANNLLPSLKNADRARIVNVASRAHMGVSLDFENLQGDKDYSGWKQYQKSKLMNIYFTYDFAEKLKNTNITVNCLHPGFVKTKFGHNNQGIAKTVIQLAQNLIAISENKGAETSIFLTTDDSVGSVTGKYFVKKKEARSSDVSYSTDSKNKLIQISERILKDKFSFSLAKV
ncbi:SDR family NAD(P)-dependent oxidoreductase [Leptospira sp. 96542]|nr:SDR family NAD(P)-dependent oxidoreductase [Leptospira sp. 96542]